ncbi:MAG: ABC transporter permease subunit [Bacillota bacterium]|nr:ABC transporter permease subunit [Bacillota bacterium]
MFSMPLLKREMKASNKLLIIFIYILTIYILSMVFLYDPQKSSIMDDMAKSMPGVMKAFGMVAGTGSLVGFIASYLYGFIILMFPIVFIIILANKLVAGYVDRGSMAYLLATPNKRVKLALTQALCLWVNIVMLTAYATIALIICSALLHPGLLNIGKAIMLNLILMVLHLAVSGICFFASCISNDTKRSFTIGAGVPIIFYLIQAVANMGGKLADLKYFTLYSLFSPNDIIAGKSQIAQVLVLAVVAVVFYALGIFIFSKKDVPV